MIAFLRFMAVVMGVYAVVNVALAVAALATGHTGHAITFVVLAALGVAVHAGFRWLRRQPW